VTPEEKLEAINEVLPGCRVIHQGAPERMSCLEHLAWIDLKPDMYGPDYRASCEEHLCLHCKILRILEAQ
jgi:hypothetical protein